MKFSAEKLDAFRAVKRAFDPAGVLNPEKLIPTLHRCAEFGRMRVHRGAVRSPALPRF
jgi:glycolate oxidase